MCMDTLSNRLSSMDTLLLRVEHVTTLVLVLQHMLEPGDVRAYLCSNVDDQTVTGGSDVWSGGNPTG